MNDSAAGFVHTRNFTLVNTSLIPMTFKLRVPADGCIRDEATTNRDSLVDSNISDGGSSQMTSPREFDITPEIDSVAAQSEIDIKVDILSTYKTIFALMNDTAFLQTIEWAISSATLARVAVSESPKITLSRSCY